MDDKAVNHLKAFLAAVVSPEEMEPSAIAAVLDLEKMMVDWFKSVRTVATARVAAKQLVVPGYALSPGRRSREWTDEATAVDAMQSAGINDPYSRKLLSVADAEKKIPEENKSMLETAWNWIPGTPTLKRGKGDKTATDAPAFEAEPETPARSTNPYGW